MVTEKDIPREMREQMVKDLVAERETLAGLEQPLFNAHSVTFGTV